MITRQVLIANRLGLHARAAAKLIQVTKQFTSTIRLGSQPESLVNAKSIMQVITLGAGQGTELLIEIEGDDEVEAIDAIIALIDDYFGEEE